MIKNSNDIVDTLSNVVSASDSFDILAVNSFAGKFKKVYYINKYQIATFVKCDAAGNINMVSRSNSRLPHIDRKIVIPTFDPTFCGGIDENYNACVESYDEIFGKNQYDLCLVVKDGGTEIGIFPVPKDEHYKFWTNT